MTEEIIIDGVNVAGWTDEEVYYKFEHHTSKAIKQIAFDLYKQLKRAEIEIEKLKGVDGSVHPDSAYYKIARLEQENKELQAYKDINEDFKKAWDELNEKYKQLRSALKEIREVATLDDVNCNISPETMNVSKDVLKIVNEVLNDN